MTRDRISEAALRLALERGPDAVTVEEIADAADVSPRTFFNYFPTKWDAIIDFDLEGHEEVADAIRSRPTHEPPLVAVREAVLEHLGFDDGDLHAQAARMQLVEQHEGLQRVFHGCFAAFEQLLLDAVVARLGPDHDPRDPYPAVLVSSVMSAMRAAVHRHMESPDGRSFAEVAHEVFDILAGGFAPRSASPPAPRSPEAAGSARA